MKYIKNIFYLLFITLLATLTSCNKDSESARLVIKLVDKSADYTAVNVDIQGVSVHTNGDAEEADAGWVDLAGSDVGVKNLLEYTGGTELTLVDTDFPAGKISQIRLKLGTENSVQIGEADPMELKTPSGQQSGLKLQVHKDLVAGITYIFKLDFDAAQSVIHNGAGKFILKPVIRVITEAKGGAIKGTVLPAEQNVLISVMKGDDVMYTTYAPIDQSEYILSGVDPGTYSIKFEPPPTPEEGSDDPVYETLIVDKVVVNNGEVTTVEPVELMVLE